MAATPRRRPPARADQPLGSVRPGLARPSGGEAGGQRVLGPARHVGHGPADPDDDPVGRVPASCWPLPVLHLRTGTTDITAFPATIDGVAGINLLNEKWPQGTRAPAPGRRHRRGPAGDPGGDRDAQDRGPGAGRPERAGDRDAVTRRQGRDGRVHDGRRPERRGQPGRWSATSGARSTRRSSRTCRTSGPTSPATRPSRSTSRSSTPTASRRSSCSSSACRSC